VSRFALDHEFHVILEGILRADHYGRMLGALVADHVGLTIGCYLDVPFAETLRRHAGKPQAAACGEAEMRDWYRERDLLPGAIERVAPAQMSFDETVQMIVTDARLSTG
jgi:hypothetical protein